ncbi:helix-turn-helix domain-containing protein [Bacteroides sp. 51]|uniref:helix-turn-helix domain-containing protein n=1 Tax=Bacteroides sp. 51 TaxID=2302938 RepID=UPI0013D280B2|nr:helix-turn-helix domain-containing protein [Bacteroides sp. 51]NDV81623.1 DNA-binding protein [Bacteroides sp. 51]
MTNKDLPEWMKIIIERFDKIDKTLERMNRVKKCFDGDILLDNHDMCQLLGVTKRTVARYRQKKLLPYYTYDNGRVYYKASEVEQFMIKKGKL